MIFLDVSCHELWRLKNVIANWTFKIFVSEMSFKVLSHGCRRIQDPASSISWVLCWIEKFKSMIGADVVL